MRSKTGWERYAYGAHGQDKMGRSAYSTVQNDDGVRVPLMTTPGLLVQMRKYRDIRRERGRRAPFTPEEADEVTRLAHAANEAGWTYREIARALGVSDMSAKNYVLRDISSS